MPCEVCKSNLIYIYDSPECPRCNNLAIVPYEDSLKIALYLNEEHKKIFFAAIKKFQKSKLLKEIFWHREKLTRKLHEKYSLIPLSEFATCTLLIKRISKMTGFLEDMEPTENDVEKIIVSYEQLIQFEEDFSRLESNNYVMLKLVKYDIENLDKLPLVNSILVCPNENYTRVMKTFEKHNILSEHAANEKMKIWEPQFVPVKPGSNKSTNSKDTIIRFYELISNLYMAFFRSKIYSEAFGSSQIDKLKIDPFDLKVFTTSFFTQEEVSHLEFSDFQVLLISKFGGKFKQFLENFVISETNVNAIPLFLRLDSEVYLSQAFTELYSYVLHAILNRDIFDTETVIRSKKFESEVVKKEFESKGFRYISNHIVKGKMEIDGIAISDSTVYVIEVKGWKARKLVEEKTSKEILDREIKNAIDGLHYVFSTNKTKKSVSLPMKVNWIIDNKNKFKIPETAEIKGLLIINESPTISEYNGCLVGFVDDFIFN